MKASRFNPRVSAVHFFVILAIIAAGAVMLMVNPGFVYKKNPNNVLANKDNLAEDIIFLTRIEPSRDSFHNESLNRAADYLIEEFSKTGCVLELQKFFADGKEYKNIICSFGTENETRLVVGAHYDAFIGVAGADDNASGAAGLLELARMFAREKPELKRRVDLVAYSLEEPPFYGTDFMGSAVHAKYLNDNNIKLDGMICLESIGYFSDAPNSQKYPLPLMDYIYPKKGNYIAVVGKTGQQAITLKIKKSIVQNADIEARSINAPGILEGVDFSDHVNYWKQGFSAAMVTDTAFYRNNNYHQKTDTIETIDFDKMAQVVRGLYFAVTEF